MTMQATAEAVRKTITVEAPIERAFDVFSGGIDRWWHRDKSIGSAPMERAVMEQREGGRWYEVGTDGSECEWGRVLVYEPPTRLVVTWQIDGRWQRDPDPSRASEIEVRFSEEGPTTTRIDLEHRNLERHGDDAAAIRAAVDSPGGWSGLLESLAAAVRA